jgi:hypothetical protein
VQCGQIDKRLFFKRAQTEASSVVRRSSILVFGSTTSECFATDHSIDPKGCNPSVP